MGTVPGADAIATADGKVVVDGSSETASFSPYSAIRLLPDGSPDPSFVVGGAVVGGDPIIPRRVVVQGNGGVVLAGTTPRIRSSVLYDSATVVRLKPNGQYDTTFGVAGRFDGTFEPANGSTGGEANILATALAASGRIIVGGRARVPTPSCCTSIAYIAWLNPFGAIDAAYGVNGFKAAVSRTLVWTTCVSLSPCCFRPSSRSPLARREISIPHSATRAFRALT